MAATPVRASYAWTVLDMQGRPIAGASIAVYQVGTTTDITETIYQDATGSSTLANPFTADSLGQFRFYLDKSKRVDLYVSATGYPTPYTLQDVDVVRTGEDPTCIVVAASDAPAWQKLGGHYICDGTADEEDIEAAIAELPATGGKIKLTQGTFTLAADVTVEKSGVLIEGQGKGTIVDLAAVGIDGFVFGDGSTTRDRCGIRDLKITSSVTKNAGAAIKFNKCRFGYTNDIFIENQYYGIEVAGDSIIIRIDRFEILDCIATNGVGIFVRKGSSGADVFITNGNISAAGGSEPSVGISLKRCSGVYITDVDIVFQKYGVLMDPDTTGDYVEYVFAHKVLTDTCTENGWGVGPAATYTVRGVWLDHCWGNTCKEGFLVAGAGTTYGVYLDHPIAMNNDEYGIKVTSGSEIHIRDPQTTDNSIDTVNTYSGIYVGAGITDWSIKGGRSTDNLYISGSQQKYGIEVAAGGADRYQIVGVDVRGNQTAGIIDGGTGTDKIIENNPGFTLNAGAANTGVTAQEHSDGYKFTTVLTVSQADALTLADNASIADGYLLYTFPAGTVVIDYAYMAMAMTAASTEAKSDTPDVGLGTVIASGAVATLDGTGTFENIITGQTAADADGTATVKTALPTAAVPFVIASGDAHTLHFNVADGWADDTGGDLTADIAGTVVIVWRFLA